MVKTQVCRFFNTKNGKPCLKAFATSLSSWAALLTQHTGCRAGDACPYLHQAVASSAGVLPTTETQSVNDASTPALKPGQALATQTTGVVIKPQPRIEDQRAFQIAQIQRRYKPEVAEKDNSTVLRFKLIPSDPDFPYDIDALDCTLTVPKSFPEADKPSLRVTNKDIPRGFQINIEQGFDMILANTPEVTLLGLFNRLDKQLETILAGEMAETVKIVVNRGISTSTKPSVVPSPSPPPVVEPVLPRGPSFTAAQKVEAQQKRQMYTRQLEARFGRLQNFLKAHDGFSYTLPLDSPKRASWPRSLQMLRTFTLLLPELYPLEPSTILLDSDSVEARNAEHAFHARSEARTDATLTQQINYFCQHIHDMALQSPKTDEPAPKEGIVPAQASEAPKSIPAAAPNEDDRSHIHVIPRPPEWSIDLVTNEEGDYSDSDDYSYDSGDDTEGSAAHTDNEAPTSAPVEKGVLLSFPQLELHGIEVRTNSKAMFVSMLTLLASHVADGAYNAEPHDQV
jgi:hypothetical protein